MFRTWAHRAFNRAMDANLRNISDALSRIRPGTKLLDLGCDDGARTLLFADAARAGSVHGVEVEPERAEIAHLRGIDVVAANLGETLPFDSGAFDVVVSNQVIEHLADTDLFLSECRRITRRGGTVIVSTENLASWHNIVALSFGWQPFSLTNVTGRRSGLGNPLAVHRDEAPQHRTWQHVRVFSYRGLVELFKAHGFKEVRVAGAGYFPLPARLGRRDPRHAAFLTVVAHV